MTAIPPRISYLQDNLQSIRKIAKWTAEDLSKKIGVTKQTISNLENNRTKMSLTQYIAIRSVLEYEVETNKDNVILPQVLSVIFDDENINDKRDEQEVKEIKDKVSMIGASVASGVSSNTILSFIGPISKKVSNTSKTFSWMKNILK